MSGDDVTQITLTLHLCSTTSWRNLALMTNPTSKILTVKQVSERLHISPRAVLQRINKGQIEANKIGTGLTSAYVITEAEVARVEKLNGRAA